MMSANIVWIIEVKEYRVINLLLKFRYFILNLLKEAWMFSGLFLLQQSLPCLVRVFNLYYGEKSILNMHTSKQTF